MREIDNLDILIVKYLKGTISEMESRDLEEWVGQSEQNRLLFEQLTDGTWISAELHKMYGLEGEKAWSRIAAANKKNIAVELQSPPPVRSIGTWKKWVAAASVILLAGIGGYLFFYQAQKAPNPAIVGTGTSRQIMAPEKNRATITLSDGRVIYLDSIADGTFARQMGTDIVKQAEDELVYKAGNNVSAPVYNTLFNPRGSRVIHVTLSDGTKVWLNSETSLRYPVSFTGKERSVEINGEAYFEVAKMSSRPFRVVAGNMNVEVLGTHFNINAYPDENITRTTLLEGKVKVSNSLHSAEISPGQQANYSENESKHFQIEQVADIEKVIAWKEGMFQFDDTELPVIMRQICRWYDIDIVYERPAGREKYGGAISKQVPLSNVLKMLETNGIQFKQEGSKIVVKP